jgi:NADP-dependent 3-hydroxy acid dehydrogenase YdfG
MGKLEQKVAIITGASSGIGEATARQLAQAGASVTLAARRVERLESLKAELEADGARVLIVPTDVTRREDCEQMVQKTIEAFGRLDILVNNAGVMLLSAVAKGEVDQWDRMIDVNVKGLMYGTNAALPHMIEQNSGHVVNISSVAGRRVFLTGAVYCATKFAVNAFTEGLRMELSARHNIRFTSIEPGIVATELTHHITDKDVINNFDKWRDQVTPLQSEDIAESVLYAVSAHPRANVNEILIMPTGQP